MLTMVKLLWLTGLYRNARYRTKGRKHVILFLIATILSGKEGLPYSQKTFRLIIKGLKLILLIHQVMLILVVKLRGYLRWPTVHCCPPMLSRAPCHTLVLY